MKYTATRFLCASLLGMASLGAQPALTIYNSNFGVVRDTVSLDLKEGINSVEYSGVTSSLEPQSVILRDPDGKVSLSIIEQSYRGDPVDQNRLLQIFEGKTIRFLVRSDSGSESLVNGKVVRAPQAGGRNGAYLSPIIEVDGELRTSLPGEPLFPSLGDGSILKPTLSWKLHAGAKGKLDAQVGYVTGGLSWEADYNVILPEKGDRVAITGWISLTNRTGKTFEDAKVKLIAGDVNKVVQNKEQYWNRNAFSADMAMAAAAPRVETKKFDEFHMYGLPLPTTLRDQETKQVEFLRAASVATRRIFVYNGAALGGNWRNMLVNAQQNALIDPGYGQNNASDIAIYREVENAKSNDLGVALPAGTMRFYRADSDGQLEFTGENTINHTPKDETLRIYLGNAFDLVGERTRVNFFKHPTQKLIRETYKIELRNRSDEDVTIQVVEPMYRGTNWTITAHDLTFKKVDAQQIEFPVNLLAGESQSVLYTVEYSW